MGTERQEPAPEQTIAPRPGLHVFPNKGGTISIQQIGDPHGDDNIVVVHPEDVPRLVELLERERHLIQEEEQQSG